MRKLSIVMIGVLLVLTLALIGACSAGGNDEDTPSAGPQGPAGATGPESAYYGSVILSPSSGQVGVSVTGSGYSSYNRVVPAPTSTPAPAYPSGVVVKSWADQSLGSDRMIVRTGNLKLKVKNIAEALDLIKAVAERDGGYVIVSNRYGGDSDSRGSSANISIRVSANQYDDAVKSLRALAVEVLQESTSASDVTDEYTDLGSQLRNLEATERQYLVLLEKADKVQDMLSVESSLSDTRGRIEQIKGRMLLLERTSAMSLININLVADSPLKVDFTVSTIEVKEGEQVYFPNQSTGGSAPYGYRWDFGDGSSSTDASPTIKYHDPGKYTVSLTVTDSKGNVDKKIMEAQITVVAKSGWSGGDTADSAWNGLVAIGRGLSDFLIWVGILAPIWIPVGLIAYFIVRRVRKRAL